MALDGLDAEERYRVEPVELASADRLFERGWALMLLEAVFRRLEEEQTGEGAPLSHDAILLAVASAQVGRVDDQSTLCIWETSTGTITHTFTNAFGPLTFSADRKRLVSTRLDGSVVIWDLTTGQPIGRIEENFTWIGALSLSPDGKLLVTASEEPVVNISELATGRRVDSLKGSSICIIGAAFAPDASTLPTCTVDGGMKFWHAATGEEIFTLGPPDRGNSFLFAPNGEY